MHSMHHSDMHRSQEDVLVANGLEEGLAGVKILLRLAQDRIDYQELIENVVIA